MKTLVILPTYNESENLLRIIQEIFNVLPETHLLVVDDNSPDGTGKIAEGLSKNDARIAVLRRASKMGLGSAYRAGFRYALQQDFEAIIQMDADFSHSPHYLPRFIQELASCDCVIGSRYIEGGGFQGWPWHRLWLSACANFYTRTILNVRIFDLTGGFRCFRRKILETIRIDSMVSEGYSFQIEFNYRMSRCGFRLKEVPIVFIDRTRGKSKFSLPIILEAIFIVWKLRFQAARSSVQ